MFLVRFTVLVILLFPWSVHLLRSISSTIQRLCISIEQVGVEVICAAVDLVSSVRILCPNVILHKPVALHVSLLLQYMYLAYSEPVI
jgi:hypothetical protein